MSNTGTYKYIDGKAVKVSDRTSINIEQVTNNKAIGKTIPHGGVYMESLGEHVRDTNHFNSLMKEHNLALNYDKA